MEKEEITLIAMIGLALIAGLVIGHMNGYQQGIDYQKAQPVSMTVEALTWQPGTSPIVPVVMSSYTGNYARPGTISMETNNTFIRENKINLWVVTVNP